MNAHFDYIVNHPVYRDTYGKWDASTLSVLALADSFNPTQVFFELDRAKPIYAGELASVKVALAKPMNHVAALPANIYKGFNSDTYQFALVTVMLLAAVQTLYDAIGKSRSFELLLADAAGRYLRLRPNTGRLPELQVATPEFMEFPFSLNIFSRELRRGNPDIPNTQIGG